MYDLRHLQRSALAMREHTMNGCTSVRRTMVAAFCGLAVQAGPAMANEALAERSGCLQCHSVNGKSIGPAFSDSAARYKGDNHARETLIEKVKQGGKGNWTKVTGGVLMPPFASLLADEEIRELVDWVLAAERPGSAPERPAQKGRNR